MANEEHLAMLTQASTAWSDRSIAWNSWRREHPDVTPDLFGANLSRTYLAGAELCGANATNANLRGANLIEANLSRANLHRANLRRANLTGANLIRANLTGANLSGATLSGAKLDGANLSRANLSAANLLEAELLGADLREANLVEADLHGAALARANLKHAVLIGTNLTNSDLTGCRVYGMAAWDLNLKGARQADLIITRPDQAEITVDNVEMAQFIYLLLNNERIRHIIETITSKAVLILGRFTPERKKVLDALREELRQRDYLPMLFDFDVPSSRDVTETVSLLARMVRFIIADLTEPSSIPKELEAIVPNLAVPVQPLLEGRARPFAMFKDYWKYDWVLPPYRYDELEPLLATLAEGIIAPAEAKVRALEQRRSAIEAELTTPG